MPKNQPAAQAAGQTLPNATQPVGKNPPFSRIAVAFEPNTVIKMPSRFRISEKFFSIVCFMTGSTILNRLGVTAP